LRAIVINDHDLFIHSRNRRPLLPHFGELARIGDLLARPCVLDGEIVVFDAQGRPDFDAARTRNAGGVRKTPATFVAFDLLELDGRWLGERPLDDRQAALAELLDDVQGSILIRSRPIPTAGRALFARAVAAGHEGVVGKLRSSPYRPGVRSAEWRKVRHVQRARVRLAGLRLDAAGRVRSALLAAPGPNGYAFLGGAGSGLGEADRAKLAALRRHARPGPPPELAGAPAGAEFVWLTEWPEVQVEYLQRGAHGRLRHPVWRGFVHAPASGRRAP
ncbi:MAG TPA: hypothetical protein VFK80_00005, partial [Limnochordia bacterium]|nr:hypothetical protein [Limnochordia bacterium]